MRIIGLFRQEVKSHQIALDIKSGGAYYPDMTPAQADRILKAGKPVRVIGRLDPQGFVAVFVRRDRWNLYTADGGIFDRGDLQISKEAGK